MIRTLIRSLAIGVLCAPMLLAQAEGPTLQPLWTLTGDFASPESAYYHAGSNSIFVSSINGQILEKDGNGYISRLSPDGKVVSAKWVTGLNAPKGIRSLGGTLWVTDIDEVVSIDIATARVTAHVKVDGALFLNDLATAPDGTVYASDSNLARIYAVKDGKSSVFVEGADQVDVPNGLLVDGTRLVLGTIGVAGARRTRAGSRRRAATERAPLRLRSHDQAAHTTHDGPRWRDRRDRTRRSRGPAHHRRDRCATAACVRVGSDAGAGEVLGWGSRLRLHRGEANRGRSVSQREHRFGVRPDCLTEMKRRA